MQVWLDAWSVQTSTLMHDVIAAVEAHPFERERFLRRLSALDLVFPRSRWTLDELARLNDLELHAYGAGLAAALYTQLPERRN